MINLFNDTETNGLLRWGKGPEEQTTLPLEIAAILEDDAMPGRRQYLVTLLNWELDGIEFEVPEAASAINGITKEMCLKYGHRPSSVWPMFALMLDKADQYVAHNTEFDWQVLRIWAHRCGDNLRGLGLQQYCTMKSSTELCRLPSPKGSYKWPKLGELYQHLFKTTFADAHGAMADCMAARKCFVELRRLGIPSAVGPLGG